MPVRVDEAGFEECSRVAGLAIAAYTLRSLEKWRTNVGDYDSVMIMVAVIAISSERLLRADLPAKYRSLSVPLDPADLAKVNIAGIAHATGLNRETARRKVNGLVERGQLVRAEDGSIALPPGLTQSNRIRDQARTQLGEICAIANQLLRMGVLAEEDVSSLSPPGRG
ncbi:hypothetical protein [Sphingosinicella sp.]|uniref:hypothetical protein n=1 Tax=Sphingosinicella sp. TaxID=1917971 RepID=UPI004037DAAB